MLFAGLLALLAVLGAVNASGASALGEQCSGSNAKGLGAFLQTKAQERWSSAGEQGFNGSKNALACSGSQGSGGTPSVGYVPLGSAAALHTWGADDGELHTGENTYHFLGTDIAPSGPVGEAGSMLANMKKALASDVAVIPVSQTAIAIAAHPPALPAHPACLVPKITSAQLQKVFSGEIKNWRQIGTASDSAIGGDCDQAITRIVREESAGTTYQFKHFLNSVNGSPLDCTGKTKRTWAQLKAPFGGESTPNVEWPQNSDCQPGEGKVTTVSSGAGEGEAGPLLYVAANAGTITYASLPEARQWAPEQVVDVFNGVKYADPETAEAGANCAGAKYTRPAGWEFGVNVDWSGVYGSDPNIGESSKNAYPICTLTWGIAATDHFGEKAATTVHDYLAFVVAKEGGQAAVKKAGYRDLPTSIAEAANVAISHINGKEEEGEEEEGGSGTVLCKAEPELVEGVLTCPKEQGFTEGKVTGTLYPGKFATFKSLFGPELTVVCPEGHYVGEFNEDGTSAGGLYQLAFGQIEGCSSTFPEEKEAVVSLENPPFDTSFFEYLGPEGPQGSFNLAKSAGLPLLRIQGSAICVYAPSTPEFQISNGSPSLMTMQGNWKLFEGSPEVCPILISTFAQMTMGRLGEEKPLYIAGK
ncbi:MAG TPA: substrate-binding domain-containing protein [Solirubrobacterales bacterium]